MNIVYIGGGFVGACSATVSADSGHQVVVYDTDENKVKKLNSGDRSQIQSCLFEEGLADLIIRNKERIEFTSTYDVVEKFINTCDAIFMCLPTPEIGETGESDLSYYFAGAEKIAQTLAIRNEGTQSKYIVIVNKSTVPISMIDQTEQIMKKHGVREYGVVSNPEFLVEGKAIQGSLHPDRVVIGAQSEKDFEIMRKIYRRFYDASGIEYIEINPHEAAAGKLLANFYLFNKLAICFDVIGRTCEAFPGLNFENIRRVLTTDPRIGTWGLYDSLYAGGSCFIKDARSLSHQLQTTGYGATLIDETYLANKRQLELFLGRAVKEAGVSWSGKRIALLGAAFKQGTNDIRNSPSLDIVLHLTKEDVATVAVYDPVAMENFKIATKDNKKVEYADQETSVLENADVVILATDWPQFRELGDTLLMQKKRPLIMDGRRILQHRYADLVDAGFSIIAVGSPFLSKNKI